MIGNVNFLTVREVSIIWEKSLDVPASVIERAKNSSVKA